MKILAIDPGPKDSAFIVLDTVDESIVWSGMELNENMRVIIKHHTRVGQCSILAIESVEGFGIPAGMETFDTCFWAGRFCEAFIYGQFMRIGRKAIKSHFCNTTTAKDKDIRAALIYRFGEPGTKKQPGKLFGISGHVWSALAVGVYQSDMIKRQQAVEKQLPAASPQ